MSIKITSSTYAPSGVRKRWGRTLASMVRKRQWCKEPRTDAEIVWYIEKYLPAMFHGCDVQVFDGGPVRHGVVDPDTKRFAFEEAV